MTWQCLLIGKGCLQCCAVGFICWLLTIFTFCDTKWLAGYAICELLHWTFWLLQVYLCCCRRGVQGQGTQVPHWWHWSCPGCFPGLALTSPFLRLMLSINTVTLHANIQFVGMTVLWSERGASTPYPHPGWWLQEVLEGSHWGGPDCLLVEGILCKYCFEL